MGSGASASVTDKAVELLGEKLLKGGEEIDTKTAFEGKKAIALYFSGHWCPPCRGFTPKLAEFYKTSLAEKGLEVVFVSSDHDESSFKDYYAEQPWLALPFSDRARKDKLSKLFKVNGIPSVVIINAENGETITTDGRSAIMKDPTGEKFPWIPPTFKEALGESFLKGEGTVGKEAVEGKTLGLYFSAHWCPPCRGFTPKLAEWYKKIKPEVGDKFEIIFCSGDRDEDGMKSYYKEQCDAGGDWLCLPYASKDNLDPLFEIEGIPTFLIVSPEGKVINKSGRGLVPDAVAADFPWLPPAIGDLEAPEGINETTAICLMLESVDKDVQKGILEKVTKIAEEYTTSGEFIFFAATKPGNVASQIRGMCGLESAGQVSKQDVSEQDAPKLIRSVSSSTPSIILMDIPDEGGYYVGRMAKEMDGSNVKKMIEDYKNKALERKQLG
jgi:nucleoredoxin